MERYIGCVRVVPLRSAQPANSSARDMLRLRRDLRSNSLARLVAACVVVVVATVSHAGVSQAKGEPITVGVKSGRRFTAEIDVRSNADKLWLRFSKETSSILRPIEWSSITEIRRGEETLSIEQVRTDAIAANAALPPKPKTALAKRAVEGGPSRGSFQTWNIRPASAEEPVEPRRPVRSISFDAYLANWDADVEADGLYLSLSALDGTGFTTPVDGTLEVELLGDRRPPLTRGNAFPVLARWSRQVTAAEMENSGGYYRTRLEFQALDPEYNLWINTHALVHVRFSVPGDGAFEASMDGVRMRGFTPVRDRAQAAFGTRFLPTERTGRGHRESSTFGP